MNFLMISESFTGLHPWFFEDKPPAGMPAVFNLWQYLGNSSEHHFDCIVINKKVNRLITLPNGSTVRLHRFRFPNHFLWKFLSLFYAYYLSSRMIKRGSYDLVYTMSFYNILSRILGKRHGIFSVSRKYGSQMMGAIEERDYYKMYIRYFYEMLAFKYPGDLTVITRDGTRADEVARYFNPEIKMHILYNGIDQFLKRKLNALPLIKFLPKDQPIKACYIARLWPYKRQDLAVKIVETLVANFDFKEIRLDIIGGGANAELLEQLIKDKALQKYIRVLPEVDHELIPETLAGYELCLFCYDIGVMGNILWESMLGGRLILVRRVGDTSIFSAKNSILVPDSESFLTEAARKILEFHGKEVSEICMNSRTMANRLILSWEERLEKEIQLILKMRKDFIPT